MHNGIPDWMSVVVVASAVAVAFITWLGYMRISRSLGHGWWSAAAAGVFVGGWLAAAAILAAGGFFEPSPASRFPAIAYGGFPLVAGVVASFVFPGIRRIVEAVPPRWIVGIQVYRTLGLLFLVLFAQGEIPGAFAVPAGVGDIVVGLTAPLVAYLLSSGHPWSRRAAILWNLVGIADLVSAILLGFLSSPGPFQSLAFESPNRLITVFPLVLIPVFVVPLSLLLHVFSLRTLLRGKGAEAAPVPS